MIDPEMIREYLQKEYSQGETYSSLAKKLGLSYSYLHDLMIGDNRVEGLTIDKLNRMFPACRLVLNGEVHIEEKNIKSNRAEVNHGTMIAGNVTEGTRDLEEKVFASEELTDSEKLKMLKLLRGR